MAAQITREELKHIQLDILQSVDAFCRANGIRYSLACGTMLGAIRHRGYIPWDDDIDIYLLREDYNRLMAEFPPVYDGRVQLVSLERNPGWDMSFAKAYDNRTLYCEYAHPSEGLGVMLLHSSPL